MEKEKESGCGCGCLTYLIFLILIVLTLYWNKDFIMDKISFFGRSSTQVMSTEQSATIKQGNVEQAKYYYYDRLSDSDKKLYEQIYTGLNNFEDKFKVNSADQELIEDIFEVVLYDHPEIFWCKGSYEVSYSKLLNTSQVKADYVYDEETAMAKQEQMENLADQIAAEAGEKDTDYQKILYVYRYIINHTDYVEDSINNQNIDSVLLNGESVCGGYTKATQYLLEKMNIFCTYVIGKAEGSNHAWNLVVCNGNYYYLDTTWGDPVFASAEGDSSRSKIVYDYFLCNDDMLLRTHTPDSDYDYPTCSSLDCNYYVVNGRYFTAYDKNDAWVIMKNDIDNKASNSTFKFSDYECYSAARDEIVGDLAQAGMRRIQLKYNIDNLSCEYVDDDQNYKIVVYWSYKK